MDDQIKCSIDPRVRFITLSSISDAKMSSYFACVERASYPPHSQVRNVSIPEMRIVPSLVSE